MDRRRAREDFMAMLSEREEITVNMSYKKVRLFCSACNVYKFSPLPLLAELTFPVFVSVKDACLPVCTGWGGVHPKELATITFCAKIHTTLVAFFLSGLAYILSHQFRGILRICPSASSTAFSICHGYLFAHGQRKGGGRERSWQGRRK